MTPSHESDAMTATQPRQPYLLWGVLLVFMAVFTFTTDYLLDKIDVDSQVPAGDLGTVQEYFGANERFEILVDPAVIRQVATQINKSHAQGSTKNVQGHTLIRTASGRLYGYDPESKMLYGKDAVLVPTGEKPLHKLMAIHDEVTRSGDLVESNLKSDQGSLGSVEPSDNSLQEQARAGIDQAREIAKQSAASSDDRLEALRKRLNERLKNEKGSANTEMSDSGSEAVKSTGVAPDQMSIANLRETEEALYYKGQKIPKVGYGMDGSKLPAIKKREQVAKMVDRISRLGDEWSVIYPAIGEEKKKIAIFSDPTCPFCQELHKQMPKLQKAGVTIHHMFYNRHLSPSSIAEPHVVNVDKNLANAWCADNPGKMLDSIYKGYAVPDTECASERASYPGNEHYFMGRLINMRGTPYTITSDGRVIAGYDMGGHQPLSFLRELGL